MTDFLTRLVDRTLGRASVAKPFIAPLFAPGPDILGPDATARQESFGYSSEQPFDTVSSDALPNTASLLVEEKQSPSLKSEESESGRQPAKVVNTPAPYSDIDGGLLSSFLPQRAASVEPLKSEEVRPIDETRKDPHRPGSYSDNEEGLSSSPPVERAAKNSPPFVTEQKTQSSRTESRGLSQRDQTPIKSTKDATRLEQTEILTPEPGVAVRILERRSPVPPSDVRGAKQRTIDQDAQGHDVKRASAQESPALQAAQVFDKGVTPVAAIPVEYSSPAAKIVRPEKVTVRGRADSHIRATSADTRSSTQNAPTIKVTIGRIEVRAVLPPGQPAQETALPAPRMSLDDYLKSVSGERR